MILVTFVIFAGGLGPNMRELVMGRGLPQQQPVESGSQAFALWGNVGTQVKYRSVFGLPRCKSVRLSHQTDVVPPSSDCFLSNECDHVWVGREQSGVGCRR
jgi:hypothetical protein